MFPSSSSALASASFWAGGTGVKAVRSACVAGIQPAIRGRDALDTSGDDLNWAAFDEQSFSMNQGIGNLFVGGFEDPAERLAGNTHFFCGISLIEPFKVRKADRLKLIDG